MMICFSKIVFEIRNSDSCFSHRHAELSHQFEIPKTLFSSEEQATADTKVERKAFQRTMPPMLTTIPKDLSLPSLTRRMSSTRLLFLLLIGCSAVSSFVVFDRRLSTLPFLKNNAKASSSSSSSPVVLSAGRTWGSSPNRDKPSRHRRFEVDPSKETFTFNSYFDCLSDPLPADINLEDIREFFALDETRLLLVSAGGRRSAKKLKLTPELVALWRSACTKYYGKELLPAQGDNVFACDSAIHFPGVTLTMTVCGGVKQLESPDGLPRGEFIVIGTKENVKGPPPLVWFFDQVLGTSGRKPDSFSLSKAEARIGISVVETEKSGQYAFKLDLKSQVRIDVPKLPFGAPKPPTNFLNEDTKAAILNTFKPDVLSAMKAARTSFLKSYHPPSPLPPPAAEGTTA